MSYVRRLKNWLLRAIDKLHWQHWVLAGVFIFVASSLFTNATVIKQQGDIKQLQQEGAQRGKESIELNRTNNRVLEILIDATSPETRAANEANTAAAVKKLDCNGQRTMQTLLIELSAQHGDEAPVIMSAECVQFFIDNPQL